MTAVVNDVKKARTGNVIASFCLDSRNASIVLMMCFADNTSAVSNAGVSGALASLFALHKAFCLSGLISC